jgi:hypothetical protein
MLDAVVRCAFANPRNQKRIVRVQLDDTVQRLGIPTVHLVPPLGLTKETDGTPSIQLGKKIQRALVKYDQTAPVGSVPGQLGVPAIEDYDRRDRGSDTVALAGDREPHLCENGERGYKMPDVEWKAPP